MQAAAPVAFLLPQFNNLGGPLGGPMWNRSVALRAYTQANTLMHWQRYEFNHLYTLEAREDLEEACRDLLVYWRTYRARMQDRHIVPHTFEHRFAKLQKDTYYQLIMHADGYREPNVYDRMCALNIMGTCPRFERDLIKYIAMFLLPSEQQHRMYYGFHGNSKAAAIDCTYEQPMIEGEVCTKAELEALRYDGVVNADDLLEDGWDADTDEEWEEQ